MKNKILLYKRAQDVNKEMGNHFKIYCYLGRTVEVLGYQVEEAHNGCYFKGKGERVTEMEKKGFFPPSISCSHSTLRKHLPVGLAIGKA